MRKTALITDKCVKLPADQAREFAVPTGAGCNAEILLTRERGPLARQLHDEVASAMFAAKIGLDVVSSLVEKGASGETLRSALGDATRSANDAMAAIRVVCAELREFGREDVDIFGDLTEMLRGFQRRTGAPCLLTIRCDCAAIETKAADRILNTVRGKLDEMVSPSGVRKLRVDICATERHYSLKIRFDTMGEPLKRTIRGNGLSRGSAPKDLGHSETAQAGAPAVVRSTVLAVKIPRDSGPESNHLLPG